jgi:hypothetical protein
MAKPKANAGRGARARAMKRVKSAAIWLLVLAGIGGVIYALANTSAIVYGERQLAVIDFTSLNEDQKHATLVEANGRRCTCGCGMTLAQCVSTDMTCPIRTDNITTIRAMVQKALSSGGGS